MLETHDLPLQFASETGIVGLALWVGAMGAALLGAWRALGRLDGDEREAALALGLVVPAFLVHGLLDYDWDFVALAGPLLFVIGFLLAAGREPVRVGRHYGWVAAVVLVAWAGLYSIAAPRIAAAPGRRRVLADRAWRARAGGVVGEERALAEPALDRGAPGLGLGRGDAGKLPRARELYAQAVDLQPLNWASWYQLGLYDREVLGHDAAARRELHARAPARSAQLPGAEGARGRAPGSGHVPCLALDCPEG